MWLGGQELTIQKEAKYLGITITMGGFKKEMGSNLRNRAMAACAAVTTHYYFDPGLLNGTLRTLYMTNIRSVLLYGGPLFKETPAKKPPHLRRWTSIYSKRTSRIFCS